jgi:phosphoserine aminotransferase
MTGGATGQFACVPLNLMNGKKKACYAVNGAWGEKAV